MATTDGMTHGGENSSPVSSQPALSESRTAGAPARNEAPVRERACVLSAERPGQPTTRTDYDHATVDGDVIETRLADVLSPGTYIDHYELIRELGRGAMGLVYLGKDHKLDRLVALKFLSVRSGVLAKRFIVEARATARCSHPNIVVIHEVGEHHSYPYMVLEYLDGQPLTELVRGRLPITAQEAVKLMIPVVRALVRAHEFGIVHRDLKPDNIFVTGLGQIKVLDFGIAKILEKGPDERIALNPSNERLTGGGRFLGTMAYMSPEQWRNEAVDHQADLWAVGVMLYEMVTGEHPLGGKSRQALRSAALSDAPVQRTAERSAAVPEALAELIDACLRKSKSERIANTAELLDRLQGLYQAPAESVAKVAYDAALVPSLRRDHAELLRLHGELLTLFEREQWEEIAALLVRFKNRLNAHLLAENTRLYNYIEKHLCQDPHNRELIRDFRQEMNTIAEQVLRAIRAHQHQPVTAENAAEVRATFERVGTLLAERIEREENDLYSMYMAVE